MTVFLTVFNLKRHMGLPQELQTWVHKYYYYLWIHRKGNAIAGLWDDLPYTLRSEIATACYKPMLKKVSAVKVSGLHTHNRGSLALEFPNDPEKN